MLKAEWQNYVAKLANGEYPIPTGMVQDYDDWRCRSIAGRALYWMGDVEAAMQVLSTVVNITPDMEDAPEFGLSEAEHKVLCLRDVAEIVWNLAKSEEAALTYLKEAYDICRAYEKPFRSASRGDMFYRRLTILKECGKAEQAVNEAKEMDKQETETVEGLNPYKYFALKFLAESAHDAGDDEQAAELYAQAFEFYPKSEAGIKDLARAATHETAAERYKDYAFCSTIQYKPWEKLPEAIIRRNL